MNRLNQTGLVVGAICVGCLLLIGSAWMAERSAAQSYGPAVGNAPAGPRKNQPYNDAGEPQSNSPPRDPIPDDESVWEDYKNLEKSPRFKDRPGNYPALFALYDFIDGMYQVRPEYRSVGFPLYFDGGDPAIESKQSLDKKVSEYEESIRKSGTKKRNKIRQYNLVIKELHFIDLDEGVPLPPLNESKLTERRDARVTEIRRRHTGHVLLVRALEEFQSLESKKIEGGEEGNYHWYMLALTKEGWKVVWYDK